MARIDDILAIEDGTAFAIALSDFVFGMTGGEGIAGLSEAETTAYVVDGLEREVNNGGFSQFYFNSAGDQARETVEALRRIGAGRMAALVERANGAFGADGPSPDREARWQQLEALGDTASELWSELDDSFYEYPDDLTGLMRAYVAAHREGFRPA